MVSSQYFTRVGSFWSYFHSGTLVIGTIYGILVCLCYQLIFIIGIGDG
ncbi:hypothetical protein AXFE_30690 [Acidithrix ferrooxidans]|uniref:Uncharacterized protein n=1 Tax=Acidithrix ferrooxidans TaxID=1280514 RepID=A0A0D8HDT1_9ACTN|nr:hypothetical protein AXFE_30690 [Acidithrix ferrooxidans]